MPTNSSILHCLDFALAYSKPPRHGTGTTYTLYLKIQECQDLVSQDIFDADKLVELIEQAVSMCGEDNKYTRWELEEILEDLT